MESGSLPNFAKAMIRQNDRKRPVLEWTLKVGKKANNISIMDPRTVINLLYAKKKKKKKTVLRG